MDTTRIPVFVDCDNTMGLPRSEIDDGLTILYLLGRRDIELVGVSATHGNGTGEQAYEQTRALFDRLGIKTPVYRAGEEAAAALTSASVEYGSLTILALGALTNLDIAARNDAGFFNRVGGIVLMGGYVRPLRFLRRAVGELNLSSDPGAAYSVLCAPCPVTVMSAQFCLSARFGFTDLLSHSSPGWLRELIREWFVTFSRAFGSAGFYLWDLVPAAWIGPDAWDGFDRPAPAVALESSVAQLTSGTLGFEPASGADASQPGVIGLPNGRFSRRDFVRHCVAHWNIGCGTTSGDISV